MADRLKGRVAIVTGGATGIGEATAVLFAEEGARVVIADTNEALGAQAAAKINDGAGEAIFVRCDVSSEDDARRLTEETLAAFDRADILVNNAAAFVLKGLEATVDEWHYSLGVNVIGTALVSRYAVEAMKRNNGGRGGGSIVNLGSMSSFIAQPDFVAYSSTKAAIVQMTRNMAMDLAAFDIRVNCVCPGTIITPASERHSRQLGITLDQFIAEAAPMALLNRVGRPREVACAILFLASEEASYVTGTHLMVDGGYTAK
jgi:NAD(P)-dependent dehydrogenase (short-subunit alcohol dehydrogenase family)